VSESLSTAFANLHRDIVAHTTSHGMTGQPPADAQIPSPCPAPQPVGGQGQTGGAAR
jgi:hypothetical protein